MKKCDFNKVALQVLLKLISFRHLYTTNPHSEESITVLSLNHLKASNIS